LPKNWVFTPIAGAIYNDRLLYTECSLGNSEGNA
jgi:hypothetical protein